MKLLGLPGRKSSTLAQMVELVGSVRLGQTRGHVQEYGFWGAEDVADPDAEPEAVIAAASGADAVIAKSFGTLVTMTAASRHGFRPARCVFIGTPLVRLEGAGRDLLEAHCARIPTLFIQQTADFNGAFDALSKLVSGPRHIACVEVPGEDHLYADTPRLVAAIEAWWSAGP